MAGIGSLTGSPTRPLSGSVPADLFADAPPREAAIAQGRNEAVDVIRLFAAAGIVFVHVAQTPTLEAWGNLFRFAVPFYLFASLYFQANSLTRSPDRPLGKYVVGRFKRLYLPFLVWSLIYLVTRDIKRIGLLDQGPIELRPALLWTGTEYHLWFLPFLLFWSIVLAVIQRALPLHDNRFRWLVIGLAIGAGLAVAVGKMPAWWNETFDNPTYSYVQSWRALPATFWAIAFALLMTATSGGSPLFTVSPFLGYAGVALALVCGVKQILYGILPIPRGLTGLGCMLAALAPWYGPSMSYLSRLGRYGYGVYLCHVLFVEPLHVIASRLQWTPSVGLDLGMFALSFAGSVALVFVLGRSKHLAWLNG